MRSATMLERRPQIIRAARAAEIATDGARVTDALGRPIQGSGRAAVDAVHMWAARRYDFDADARALEAVVAREWPSVVGDTFLWAASTPLQGRLADRLVGAAALPAGPGELFADIDPMQIDLSDWRHMNQVVRDGVKLARWIRVLDFQAGHALSTGAVNGFKSRLVELMGRIANNGARFIPFVRALLSTAARIQGGLASVYYQLFWLLLMQLWNNGQVMQRHAEVARFVLHDDPELLERAEFQGALNLLMSREAVDAWLADEMAAAAGEH